VPPEPTPFPQFLRYASAGAIGTGAHFATLIALVQGGFASPVAASTAGAFLGALVNYLINYRFTFESRRAHVEALPRFALVAIAGIVLNAGVLAGLLTFAGPHYLVAQLVATGAVVTAGYLANRAWTF
jgi:putative flippase GtrA